jgi:hypothetical protein
MKDFADFIAARARKKSTDKAAPEAPKAGLTEEENAFNASVGLRIKCGVCGAMHRSSRVDVLPSLKSCIAQIVETFKKEQQKSYYSEDQKLFPTWNKDQTVLLLRYTVRNYIDAITPSDPLWTATHKKFLKDVTDVKKRIAEIFLREINADVSMSDILGASNSVAYVRLKLDEFQKRTIAEQAESDTKQFDMAGEIGRDLKNWRKLPLETFKVDNVAEKHNYENVERVPRAVESVTVNGVRLGDSSLLGSFDVPSLHNVLWHTKSRHVERYVIDLGLVNKFPALLWSLRAQQGYKERRRRRYSKHGKPEFGITVLSTWMRKHYLVHGMPRNVKAAEDCTMTEIVPNENS